MRPLACLVTAAAVALAAAPADAKPKKKYHFELEDVRAAKEITKPEVAKLAQDAAPRIKAQYEKLIGSNPQIVATLDGAPDPTTDAAGFTRWLAKKKIDGAYKVTIDVTAASETIEPVEDKPNTQRIVVHLEVHMFGEAMPVRKMGFYGDGASTVKEEVGKKIRKVDEDAAWDDAATEALTKALDESLTKLSLPPPKPSRK
jgi:hypothetical protein